MKEYNLIDDTFEINENSLCELKTQLKDNVDDWSYESGPVSIGGGWIYEVEERFGGREGAGETHWIVFSLEKDGNKRYFEIDGYYGSYDGAYLDGTPYEVVPGEKVVTVWNAK